MGRGENASGILYGTRSPKRRTAAGHKPADTGPIPEDGAGTLYALESRTGGWKFAWIDSNISLNIPNMEEPQRILWMKHRKARQRQDLPFTKERLDPACNGDRYITWAELSPEAQLAVKMALNQKPKKVPSGTNSPPLED